MSEWRSGRRIMKATTKCPLIVGDISKRINMDIMKLLLFTLENIL
jgi:hypothetical protein